MEDLIQELIKARATRINHDDLFDIYSRLGKIGVIESKFGPGKSIIRGRINENCSFENVADLSYKPQELNKTYQRASTPNKTMFYGAIRPEKNLESEITHPYVIIAWEISPFLRDENSIGEQKITFGRWEIINEIKVAAIIFEKEFLGRTALSTELNDGFDRFLIQNPGLMESTKNWNNFIASEFSRIDIRSEYEYLISSTYTEFLLQKGFDGVLYPSVRADGRGFNIALKPEVIEKALRLSIVAECTIYKFKKQSVMDWDRICVLKPDSDKIMYEHDENHLGKQFCLNILQENIKNSP